MVETACIAQHSARRSVLAYCGVVLTPGARGEIALQELDTRGLACPLPLLKAKQALNRLASGEQLRVLATDPGSQRDFRVFAEQSGHVLIESSVCGEEFHYLLQKR